jgi:hypothetical protein
MLMRGGLGQANKKAKFGQMFSRNAAVNKLAAARIFLFGARDVWFVVGLPVFLSSVLGWTFWQSGGFLAVWVIGYGIVQAATPRPAAQPRRGATRARRAHGDHPRLRPRRAAGRHRRGAEPPAWRRRSSSSPG